MSRRSRGTDESNTEAAVSHYSQRPRTQSAHLLTFRTQKEGDCNTDEMTWRGSLTGGPAGVQAGQQDGDNTRTGPDQAGPGRTGPSTWTAHGKQRPARLRSQCRSSCSVRIFFLLLLRSDLSLTFFTVGTRVQRRDSRTTDLHGFE